MISRRGMIKAGLAATVAASLPGRALAQIAPGFSSLPYPPTGNMLDAPVAPLVADPAALLAIARQQLGRLGANIPLADKVGIVNFSLHSSVPRFFLVDMVAGRVTPYLVTHGRGSDPEHSGFLRGFSNVAESEASSRGAYRTSEYYFGKHGASMRLNGLDLDNSNAEPRAIVVHGAWYANPDIITETGKLGRSEGCFAFGEAQIYEVLSRLGPGRLLFADRFA